MIFICKYQQVVEETGTVLMLSDPKIKGQG